MDYIVPIGTFEVCCTCGSFIEHPERTFTCTLSDKQACSLGCAARPWFELLDAAFTRHHYNLHADSFMLMHVDPNGGHPGPLAHFKHAGTRDYCFLRYSGEVEIPRNKDVPFMRGAFLD